MWSSGKQQSDIFRRWPRWIGGHGRTNYNWWAQSPKTEWNNVNYQQEQRYFETILSDNLSENVYAGETKLGREGTGGFLNMTSLYLMNKYARIIICLFSFVNSEFVANQLATKDRKVQAIAVPPAQTLPI